ncbi:TPA: hypothetical protein ACICB7_003600 [Klebsiella aerogenes]
MNSKQFIDTLSSLYVSIGLEKEYPLIEKIGKPVTWLSGELYTIDNNKIYISTTGNIPIYYGNTKHFVGFLLPFTPLGLIETIVTDIPIAYLPEKDIELIEIDRDDFLSIYKVDSEENLKLISLLVYLISILMENYREQKFDNRFQLLKTLIYRYKSLSENNTGFNQSISNFIIKKLACLKVMYSLFFRN